MAYRISLHLLAAVWHGVLLALALSLRKNHRYYNSLVPVCFFSTGYTLAWALGLIFESTFLMRFTWLGTMWPTALYFFICDIFRIYVSPLKRKLVIGLGVAITMGGFSPWGLVEIRTFVPFVDAIYGPLEPWIRIGMLFQMMMVVYLVWQLIFSVKEPSLIHTWPVLTIGFLVYSAGAILVSSFLPIFGNYQYLESASYGSVVWTTFSVWVVFKELQFENRALSDLDVFKKTLINHVTHEFRTPLGAITSAVDVLAHTPADQQKTKSEYLGMIEQNAERLTHFVNELLDLAAIQQARVKLLKSTVDVAELIGNVITQLQPLAQKQKTILDFEGGSVLCECDADKIEQVVSNLISNAIKATPQGRIQIQLSDQDKAAMVSVSDNGVGLSAEHLPHIFSSFYQVQLRAPQHKGSGLGLAIAKGWVESHGGTLHAESAGEGHGSRFWFTIPK